MGAMPAFCQARFWVHASSEHPLAQREIRPQSSATGMNSTGTDQAPCRVVPAKESLDADDPPCLLIDLGLIVQRVNSWCSSACSEVTLQAESRLDLLVHLGRIELVAIPPSAFARYIARSAFPRSCSGSDSSFGKTVIPRLAVVVDLLGIQHDRFGDHLEKFLRKGDAARCLGQVGLNDGELVAAKARDDIAGSYGGTQPAANRLKSSIAVDMPQAVVDHT